MISRIQKFYRYFVYRIYHINNNDPEMKVISFIFMVHSSLVLSFFIILDINFDIFPPGFDKSDMSLLALLFFALQFLINSLFSSVLVNGRHILRSLRMSRKRKDGRVLFLCGVT